MNIKSEQEMLKFGEDFAKSLHGRVIELVGDVGAGKTTFTRGFAKGLGIKSEVTSPSFTISKSYALPDGKTLTHYDFYRLKDPGLMEEDLAEKLSDESNIIIIEWGESVADLLPENHTTIVFNKNDDGSRYVTWAGDTSAGGPPRQRARGKALVAGPDQDIREDQSGANERVEKGTLRLYLDTSTPTTILKLDDHEYTWESGHNLAEKLLEFIHEKLEENGKNWQDLTEITFMSGPGSFTGLRIGAAVVNTLAHELNIPLFDHKGKKHQIILPEYGRSANITKPKK